MKNATITLLGMMLLISVLAGIAASHEISNTRHQYEVQQLCDQARAEVSGTSEKTCQDVQEKYHVEFLCTSTAPGASCWVEIK